VSARALHDTGEAVRMQHRGMVMASWVVGGGADG
jgi:hypothetical protein